MIIIKKELEALQKAIEIERIERERCEEYVFHKFGSPGHSFLYRNPHFLLLLGFDEYRVLERSKRNIQIIETYVGKDAAFPSRYESLYRKDNSGEWQLFQGLMAREASKSDLHLQIHFRGFGESNRYIFCEELYELVRRTIDYPYQNATSLVLPSIWLPENQSLNKIQLIDSTREIITAISNEAECLSAISWRQLEEIVAELLRSQGMAIHLTKRSRDGGRDIIARGELVSGEPMLLAVEVKQKAIVGIEDVQRTLRANEDYPGLMVATSGRFSAGVVSEKRKNRNMLRLFLKDGVALKQWINAYTRTII